MPSDRIKIAEVESIQQYDKWMEEIPYLKFPADWDVKIIPPFLGAIVRFRVKRENSIIVSVYLDCNKRLAKMDEPYWEVYPYKKKDTIRIYMNDTDELIDAIGRALGNKRKKLTKN